MTRSDQVYIEDILECIDLVLDYIYGKTEFEFLKNTMLQDAVIRRFEIIGEASGKISDSLKEAYPAVQWRLMKAMRNKLIHDYYGVSPNTIFASINFDFPVLKEQLVKIIEDSTK